MTDRYKEIGAGLAVIGSIVYAFHLFMDWTGIPSDLEANFGLAVKDLFWVVSVVLLIIAGARFLHHYGIAGAGANPIGTGPREKYDALRKSLAAHEDAKDGYARRLKAFLAKVDAFFGDTDVTKQRFFLLRERAALWTAPALDRCLLLALLCQRCPPGWRGFAASSAIRRRHSGPHRIASPGIILPKRKTLRV